MLGVERRASEGAREGACTFIKSRERFAVQAGLQAGGGDGEPGRHGEAGRGQPQRDVTRGEELVREQVGDGGAERGVGVQHPPDQRRGHGVYVLRREGEPTTALDCS